MKEDIYANFNRPPNSELFRELNLTKPQWFITARYWDQRIRVARIQRNTIIWLVLVVIMGVLVQSLEIQVDAPATNSNESIVAAVYDWIVPVALVLGVAFLIIGAVLVAALNRMMTRTGLSPEKIRRIIVLGNDVALHTLMLKKTPAK